jgi:Fe-S cluster assembly iron-binding protein IscA
MSGRYAFTLTAAAAEQVRRAAQGENAGMPLRVAAKRERDGAIVYGMGFDVVRDEDIELDCAGVRVLVAPPSSDLLRGATLDFVERGAGEYQFVFVNPNEAPAAAV